MDKGKDTGNGAVKTSPLFTAVFIHWILDNATRLFGSVHVFARVPQYSHLQFHYPVCICAVRSQVISYELFQSLHF